MLKKICLLSSLVFVSIITFGAYVTAPNNQLNHIKTQMFALKRLWNSARLRIKIAQKSAPSMYQTLKPVLEKIISSDQFSTKLSNIVQEQFDAIVGRNASFGSVKTEFKFADFFPTISMTTFGQTLFSAMATKECCLLLGRKLAQKIQELETVTTTANQQIFLSIQ
jgi:hypothetical protein